MAVGGAAIYYSAEIIYIHSQLSGGIGQRTADGTKADNAQFFVTDLMTRKLGLALLYQFCHIRTVFDGLYPVDTADNVTAGKEHTAESCFLNAVRICAGSVEYNNTLLSTLVKRNVVDTCAGSCNRLQVVAELHIVHDSGTNHDRVGIFDILGNRIILIKNIGAALCNFIE